MKCVFPIVIVILSGFLSGCLSTGKVIEDETLLSFTSGVTTEADIIDALGQPSTRTLKSNGTKRLTYASTFTEVEPHKFIPIIGAITGDGISKVQSIDIDIDENGVLADWRKTENTAYIDM